MRNKDLLRKKIEEILNKASYLIFAYMYMEMACEKRKEITKEWALKAEKMLNDIDIKCEEFYRYCIDLYKTAIGEERQKKG